MDSSIESTQVNEMVGSGDWDDSKDLGNTWIKRNSYSYGKAGEKGQNRGDVLKALLNSTDRIVQQVDSVEYGLTDIQEYFANTGYSEHLSTATELNSLRFRRSEESCRKCSWRRQS